MIGEVTLAGCGQDETYGDYGWELRDPVLRTAPLAPRNRANSLWFQPWDQTPPTSVAAPPAPSVAPRGATRHHSPAHQDPTENNSKAPGGRLVEGVSPSQRRTTSSDVDIDEAMAPVRRFFVANRVQERGTASVVLARSWGFARTIGTPVAHPMDTVVRTAARRGIVESVDGQMRLVSRVLDGHDRNQLKRQFTASMGRGWVTREETIQRFARWMGLSRTGAAIDATCRSLIRGMVREGRVHQGHRQGLAPFERGR